MVGLFLSLLILYAIACVVGFAIGWRLRAHVALTAQKSVQRDIEALQTALHDAQVRRAGRAA